VKPDAPTNELAVAASKRRLDALATAHPELIDHDAPPWTDRLDELADVLDHHTEGNDMARRPTTTEREPTTQVAFRLEPSLIARLDAHAARMSAATPGLTFSRIDALRALLVPALDVAEAEGKRGGRR
jgi:hypothetical protein